MICPRCKTGTLKFKRWNFSDYVAVCSHEKKCGYRYHIKWVHSEKEAMEEFKNERAK